MIVGHGSRDALANSELEALGGRVPRGAPRGTEIAHAYVELARPGLPAGLATLARRCHEVVVLALFRVSAMPAASSQCGSDGQLPSRSRNLSRNRLPLSMETNWSSV